MLGVSASPRIGKTLIVGSSDGFLLLVDVATWRVRRTLPGPGEWIYFSRDGVTMYTVGRKDPNGYDVCVKQWDTSTWRVTRVLPTHDFPSAVSADDQTLAVSMPKASALQVWSLNSGQVTHTLPVPGKPGYLVDASFSPDGKMLAVGCMDGTVQLWDTRQWKIVRSWKYRVDDAEPVAFSPDGRTLAVGSNSMQVELLDVATGRTEHTLAVETDVPYLLTFSPDGTRLVTQGMDDVQTQTGRQWHSNDQVDLWDVRRGDEVARLEGVA